ncbi:MAG: hypothetical protein ACTHMS_19760 [Jatrophihabitans sp.]|uniref:hypothetical protein n=1 Tax=Jatrophihabitans sp. TaxID=1932789 RepID=UPI003F821672
MGCCLALAALMSLVLRGWYAVRPGARPAVTAFAPPAERPAPRPSPVARAVPRPSPLRGAA